MKSLGLVTDNNNERVGIKKWVLKKGFFFVKTRSIISLYVLEFFFNSIFFFLSFFIEKIRI